MLIKRIVLITTIGILVSFYHRVRSRLRIQARRCEWEEIAGVVYYNLGRAVFDVSASVRLYSSVVACPMVAYFVTPVASLRAGNFGKFLIDIKAVASVRRVDFWWLLLPKMMHCLRYHWTRLHIIQC